VSTTEWYSSCGKFGLTLDNADIEYVCWPGDNQARVREVMKRDYLAQQLVRLDPKHVSDTLWETGAWESTELKDEFANLERLVWIAMWDCKDT